MAGADPSTDASREYGMEIFEMNVNPHCRGIGELLNKEKLTL